jgi:hypothetical protein
MLIGYLVRVIFLALSILKELAMSLSSMPA